jgi:shikimate kinase
MMGAGKSSVGIALAKRLELPFLDTDAEIEREAGSSVGGIFRREGEPSFRARELRAIEAVAGRRAVVALGGGALGHPKAREQIEASGVVVYLRARPETLAQRLGEALDRPLLSGLDPRARLERLRDLLRRREADYARAAIVVDTDALALDQVVERVIRRLAGAGC